MDNHVDLIINGHEHSMEASYPLFNSTVTATNYKSPTGRSRHVRVLPDHRPRIPHWEGIVLVASTRPC